MMIAEKNRATSMVVDAAPIGPQGVPQAKGKKRKDARVVYPRRLAKCEGEKP